MRFYNFEQKVYWQDEADTSLRISGHTRYEVTQQFFTGNIINIKEFYNYQHITPGRSFVDTFKSLTEDVHPPLYFMIARFWVQWFGDSIAVTRSFSAFLSLLTFPCIYWLCIELFGSSAIGWMAIMIVAVSPFHILYAQEARMYSLWTVLILLSSAALLRARRLNTKFSWLAYSATIILSYYTHLLSILLVISHGVYTFVCEKLRLSKKLFNYIKYSLVALLIYSPWILIIIFNWDGFKKASSWIKNGEVSLLNLLKVVINNISNSFIDLWFAYTYFPDLAFPKLRIGIFIKPLLMVLIAYSIYFLCRKTPREVWLFVLTLIGTTPLLLIVRDLAAGAGSSSQARYLIPCYLGIQISIAYLLTTKLFYTPINAWQKKLWQLTTFLLIFGGILSCSISSQAKTWSNKYGNNLLQVAHIVNQAKDPLLISDSHPAVILSLSNYLEPKVQIQLVVDPNVPQISKNFSEVFLFQASEDMRQDIQEKNNYNIVPVKKIRGLGKIEVYE